MSTPWGKRVKAGQEGTPMPGKGFWRSAGDRLFGNAHIDQQLARGVAPAKLKAALRKEMGGLSKREQDKIMRRVDARAHKRGQGG